MNASYKRLYPSGKLRPLVIVLTLAMALPASAALAASTDDVVRTRTDQNIYQQYGRDSVYAFSPDAKPLKPAQTGSRDTNILNKAWHKTEGLAAAAWATTAGFFHEHQSSTVTQVDPERYGRAGGYVGADRIAVLASGTSYGTPNQVTTSADTARGQSETGVQTR